MPLVLIERCPRHGLELHRDGACDRCVLEKAGEEFVARYPPEDEPSPDGPYVEPEDW